MSDKHTINLTDGSVIKRLIVFAMPLLLSNIVQSLYSVADMWIVGRFNGPVGISGVNIGGNVTFLMTMMVIGLCIGSTVIIAQYVGSNNHAKIQATISTLLLSLVIAAVFITTIMLFLSTHILKLINTPSESFTEAKNYLNITVVGIIFIFLYNAMSSIMRGMGNSKTPMVFIIIACITNVVLDFIFVGYIGMGTTGAALATVISQAMSMFMCVIYLKRNKFTFDFKLTSFKFDRTQFRLVLKIGLPISITNVINNISFLFLTSIVNSFGIMASSGVGIVGKFNGFAIMPAFAISASVSTLGAQNIGAGYYGRAKKTLFSGFAVAFALTSIIFFLAQLFPSEIISIFDSTPEMVELGVSYLRVSTFTYLIIPFTFCLNGFLNGSGHSMVTSVSNVCSSLLFRIPIAYLLGIVFGMGLPGVALSMPLSDLGAAIISFVYFLTGRWKVSKVLDSDFTSQVTQLSDN